MNVARTILPVLCPSTAFSTAAGVVFVRAASATLTMPPAESLFPAVFWTMTLKVSPIAANEPAPESFVFSTAKTWACLEGCVLQGRKSADVGAELGLPAAAVRQTAVTDDGRLQWLNSRRGWASPTYVLGVNDPVTPHTGGTTAVPSAMASASRK